MKNHCLKEMIIKLNSQKNKNKLTYEDTQNMTLNNKSIKDKFWTRKNIFLNDLKKRDISNKNKNKRMINNKSIIFLFNLFFIFLSISLTKQNRYNLRKLNCDSIITLTINEIGIQKILCDNFNVTPYEVLVNGNLQKNVTNKVILQEKKENVIIMKFNTTLISSEKMFYGLTNVTKIDFSEFDFSQVKSMKFMFYDCKQLEYINFTYINTSSVIYMSDLFTNCEKLTSLDLSYFDTSNVVDMLFMFYKCSSLKILDLSNFRTNKVLNMNSMFNGCINLTSINLLNFDTSSVETMYCMFKNCQLLSSLDLLHFNTSSVTSIGDMFYNCSSLKVLDLSKFNISKVDSLNNMFRGCNNLISLDLSNFNTSFVNSMEHMFSFCNEITSINLSSFDTSKTENMKYMFNDCQKLKSLDLSNFNTLSVKDMSYMFNQCKSLKSLNLSNFDGSSVTTTMYMFNGSEMLSSLDLSNFKASSIKNMQYMFSDCQNLISLNLSNFITPNSNNMRNMFYNCKKLESLDIPNLITSSVTNMQYMFSNCEHLLSLDLSNFDISSVTRIDNMFSNCKLMIYLNLKSFMITEKIKNKTDFIDQIANDVKFCLNSTYEDFLSELNISPQCNNICFQKNIKIIEDKRQCIESCKEDNEYKFEFKNKCYKSCPVNTHNSSTIEYLCEENLECELYTNIDKSECFNEITEGYYLKDPIKKILDKCHKDCKSCDEKETIDSTNCKTCPEGKFIIFGNCTDSCKNGFDTNSEGNNICKCSLDDKCQDCSKESYAVDLCITCNDNFYPIFNEEINNNNGFINCYKNPEGYYLDIKSNNYKSCHPNCKKCTVEGNSTNNNCDQCIDGLEFKNDFENNKNCYEICKYYYYYDELNDYHCTENEQCPKNQSKLILDKRKCIDECKNDNIYQYEYDDKCYKKCPTETIPNNNNICIKEIIKSRNETESILDCSAEKLFLTKSCGTEITSNKNKDQLISNIEDDIINRRIDDLIDNITKTKQDLLVKENDTIYQITTSDNQKNNDYKNISSLNLGDCEDRLKQIYHIDPKLSLLIFKIDYYSEGLLIPIISYEVFDPVNKTKLDLNYCKDILVELNIPVSIDEDNLFKYDPNSEYYTDECIPSTSENGTDIIINDRQNEYVNNNLSLCQNNCTFTGYEQNTKKALCDCEVKTKINLISEIIDDKNKLSNDFNLTNTTSSSSNIVTMKCVYTLFTKDGLISNIGSYIFAFIIVIFLLSSILFYKIGYTLLENDIQSIINEKQIIIEQNNTKKVNIYKNNKKRHSKINNSNIKKLKKSKNSEIINFKYPPKRKSLEYKKNNNLENVSQSKLKLKDVQIKFNFQKRKSQKLKSTRKSKLFSKGENPKIVDSNNFNDFVLNSLSYKEALLYDKRTYGDYYISLLKTKHPIIFSFIPIKDYNTMIIKICLFFLSFSIYYIINAVFFDESTIHQIYENNGDYNISFFLKPIILSFIFGHFFNTVIKYIFLSERNLLEIKKEPNFIKAKEKTAKIKRDIIIKYIFFFIAGLLLLIFFWYYLSSFGAVYKNSQVYLIKNTLMSFLISLLYPFIINIFPAFLRINSLKNANKCKQNFFTFSKFLQMI